MKNNKITTLLLNGFIGLLLISPSLQGAGIIKAPQDPPAIPAGYSPTAPEWKVSSAFGPRDPGSVGRLFHGGIDYNQQEGNNDLGIPIKALAAGTITTIDKDPHGIWYVSISSSFGSLQYLHLFENSNQAKISIANTNTFNNGYSKIVLANISVINNSSATLVATRFGLVSLASCNAIYFYNPVGGIDKILTTTQCNNVEVWDPIDKSFKIARSTVSLGEPIAPLGNSINNIILAHLHLQYNHNIDNPLAIIEHPESVKEKLTVSLATDTGPLTVFDDTVFQTMTTPGFVIKVEDSNLQPDLNQVIVSCPDCTGPATEFNFGGREGEDILNANYPQNIDRIIDLEFGANKPTIKPIKWSESGTTRIMYFLVPYPDMTQLKAGVHDLNVTLTTVTGTPFDYPLKFSLCTSTQIKVGNLEVQSCDYVDNFGKSQFNWEDANAAAQTYGPGWRLPTKDESYLLFQTNEPHDFSHFQGFEYWSSTENNATEAWIQQIRGGGQWPYLKTEVGGRVHAVRTF